MSNLLNNQKAHSTQKLYLFYDNDRNWELLIGSSNFTNEAFTRNTEASALINSSDIDAGRILETALALIEQSWNVSTVFNKKELENYRIAWKNHRPKINSLSGRYGGNTKKTSKPIYEVPIANLSWTSFMNEVKKESGDQINGRLSVISITKELFGKVIHFNQLNEDERKFIADIPNKLKEDENIDWGWFGSMKGAGIFKNRIKENDPNISKALDQIPFFGQVTKANYDNFIKHFTRTFSGNYISTSTRLLAMKRPDTFVCLDTKNNKKLCKDFGIKPSGMNYERYWSDIIERIFDCEWWINPDPKNNKEKQICDSRAAFLDALYYER